MRYKDVRFFYQGKEVSVHGSVDEVRITFGKQKRSDGGDIRAQFAADHSMCVVAVLVKLFRKVRPQDLSKPVFSWEAASKHPGKGVRYVDVLKLIKDTAATCGLDSREYATHSMRRGGAAAYLLAGMPLEACKWHGRWASLESMKPYAEPAVKGLTRDLQWRVVRGVTDTAMQDKEVPREREFELWRVRQAAMKLQRRSH